MNLIIFLLIILSLFSCEKKEIYLSTNDDIKKIIEETDEDVTIILREGKYSLNKSIKVPSNVSIVGEGRVDIYQKLKTPGAVFKLSGVQNILFKNMNLYLGSNAYGFLNLETDEKVKNIHIEKVNIFGNFHENLKTVNSFSKIAVYLSKANNFKFKNGLIKNTYGGVYVRGSNILVYNSRFVTNNVSSIALAGKNLNIVKNYIRESGKGSKFFSPRGDGITIGKNSRNIRILSNNLDTGYCYIIWMKGRIDSFVVEGNVIKGGITSGLMIDYPSNGYIKDNLFYRNSAHGIAIKYSNLNTIISDNIFYDDVLFLADYSGQLSIENNKFLEMNSNAYKGKISALNMKSNKVSRVESKKAEFSVTYNNLMISKGESVRLNKAGVNKFELNVSESINLLGLPQVNLSRNLLSTVSMNRDRYGTSNVLGFEILSRGQPNTLIVEKENPVSFYINNINTVKDEIFVNIVYLHKKIEHFWFKIRN